MGNNTNIDKSTYIHPCVKIGKNVKIGPNCSIGYDGFAFLRDENNIPQGTKHEGGVIIEDNVEIQANVAIARGVSKKDNTIIGKNVKMDNQIHIAHNCEVGEGTLIAAGTTFGGTTKVGKNNFLGLNCIIKSNCTIGDFNLIGMGSVITKDIPNNEIWAGNPAKKLRNNLMFKRKDVENN